MCSCMERQIIMRIEQFFNELLGSYWLYEIAAHLDNRNDTDISVVVLTRWLDREQRDQVSLLIQLPFSYFQSNSQNNNNLSKEIRITVTTDLSSSELHRATKPHSTELNLKVVIKWAGHWSTPHQFVLARQEIRRRSCNVGYERQICP